MGPNLQKMTFVFRNWVNVLYKHRFKGTIYLTTKGVRRRRKPLLLAELEVHKVSNNCLLLGGDG